MNKVLHVKYNSNRRIHEPLTCNAINTLIRLMRCPKRYSMNTLSPCPADWRERRSHLQQLVTRYPQSYYDPLAPLVKSLPRVPCILRGGERDVKVTV